MQYLGPHNSSPTLLAVITVHTVAYIIQSLVSLASWKYLRDPMTQAMHTVTLLTMLAFKAGRKSCPNLATPRQRLWPPLHDNLCCLVTDHILFLIKMILEHIYNSYKTQTVSPERVSLWRQGILGLGGIKVPSWPRFSLVTLRCTVYKMADMQWRTN